MKKYFSFAAAALACCAVISCGKDDPKGNGGENGGNEKPVTDVVNISIDGDFSDWDAITKSSEDGTVYFCKDGAEGYKNIRNLKATSDPDFIYMYFEVSASKICMKEGGHHGDSMDGMGFASPAPIWIYVDSDNNSATGLKPHWIGDIDKGGLAFSDFQFDNGLNLFTWIAPETGLWDMGWQQANVKISSYMDGDKEVVVEDGTSIEDGTNYKWITDEYPDGYGWSHFKDNTIITFDNFKTAVKDNGWAICELAINRALLVDNNGVAGPDMKEIAFGVANQSASAEGNGGWSGIIPSDRKPAVLKLID